VRSRQTSRGVFSLPWFTVQNLGGLPWFKVQNLWFRVRVFSANLPSEENSHLREPGDDGCDQGKLPEVCIRRLWRVHTSGFMGFVDLEGPQFRIYGSGIGCFGPCETNLQVCIHLREPGDDECDQGKLPEVQNALQSPALSESCEFASVEKGNFDQGKLPKVWGSQFRIYGSGLGCFGPTCPLKKLAVYI